MRTLIVLTGTLTILALVAGTNAATSKERIVGRPSSYGRILFDGRGFALYAFTHDPNGRSTCSGACATAWPPYVVMRTPTAGTGAKASLLGVIRRAGGRLQATYAGRPLYYYVGDRRPGQILCQGVNQFGGFWRVMRPTGGLVR